MQTKQRKYDLNDELLALFGVRISQVNSMRSLSFDIARFKRDLANITRSFKSVATNEGKVTDRELEDAYDHAENRRQEAVEEMYHLVQAAKRLNVDPKELRALIDDTTTKEMEHAVYTGELKPFEPSKQLQTRMKAASPNAKEYDRRRRIIERKRREAEK